MEINLKIGVDVDEVLANLVEELNKFYNLTYGTNFSVGDYHTYDLEDTWSGTKERSVQIVKDFYNSSFFEDIEPIEGSQEAVKILSERHDLIAITSRPNFMQRKTENWIERYFPKQIKRIICTGQYFLRQNKISKLDVCLKENIGVIIEDNYQTAFDCSKNRITAFLFDNKPWNRSNKFLDNGVIRVKNWQEILEKIDFQEIKNAK